MRMGVMGNMEARLPETPDELQGARLDLMNRLLVTIQEWGKAHSQKGVKQLGDVILDALVRSIVTICLYRELFPEGSRQDVQKFLQRVNKDGPIEDDDDELVVAARARRDLLLRNLKREVGAF